MPHISMCKNCVKSLNFQDGVVIVSASQSKDQRTNPCEARDCYYCYSWTCPNFHTVSRGIGSFGGISLPPPHGLPMCPSGSAAYFVSSYNLSSCVSMGKSHKIFEILRFLQLQNRCQYGCHSFATLIKQSSGMRRWTRKCSALCDTPWEHRRSLMTVLPDIQHTHTTPP